MTDKIEITPRMVAEAYVKEGDTLNSAAASYVGDAWIKRLAKNLTEQLNPPPWRRDGDYAVRRGFGGGSNVATVTLSVNTNGLAHGADKTVRRRMAQALADILNEKDFKREDYI